MTRPNRATTARECCRRTDFNRRIGCAAAKASLQSPSFSLPSSPGFSTEFLWGGPPGLRLTSRSASLGPPIIMKNQSPHLRGINRLPVFQRSPHGPVGPSMMMKNRFPHLHGINQLHGFSTEFPWASRLWGGPPGPRLTPRSASLGPPR